MLRSSAKPCTSQQNESAETKRRGQPSYTFLTELYCARVFMGLFQMGLDPYSDFDNKEMRLLSVSVVVFWSLTTTL